ncbi:MAG: hypothetical protein WKF82_04345 [Nocardioidaceae bacterium]
MWPAAAFTTDPRQLTECFTAKNALALGITPNQLRGSRWERVSHGLYATAGLGRDDVTRAKHLLTVLPEHALIADLTAAAVYQLWLPELPSTPIMASVPPGVDRPRRRGLYVARTPLRMSRDSTLTAQGRRELGIRLRRLT